MAAVLLTLLLVNAALELHVVALLEEGRKPTEARSQFVATTNVLSMLLPFAYLVGCQLHRPVLKLARKARRDRKAAADKAQGESVEDAIELRRVGVSGTLVDNPVYIHHRQKG